MLAQAVMTPAFLGVPACLANEDRIRADSPRSRVPTVAIATGGVQKVRSKR